MKNKIIKSILGILIIILIAITLTGCVEVTPQEEECEHDWVVTSKYSFFADAYKTISKCSKCGKVVE